MAIADHGRPGWNRGLTFPAQTLTPGEVNALLRRANPRGRGLIAVMYRGGLRVSEALALLPSDLDPEACSLLVRRGKGGYARTVGLDAGAVALLQVWLTRRRALELGPGRPLFCTRDGRPLTDRYVGLMLRRLARRAGLERRVHAHALRHSMAAELAREGVPAPLIQAQLGHRSLATTDVYVRHLAGEHLAAAAARPPLEVV